MASFHTNLAVCIAMLAWLLHRASVVGVGEALAEVFGMEEVYASFRDAYAPLHPELFALRLELQAVVDPLLLEALTLHNATHRASALLDLATSHGSGVFTIPLMRPDFARRLAEEVRHFKANGYISALPNSMNEHGVVLGADGLDGLDALMQRLRDLVLSPLSAALYSSEALGMQADGDESSADQQAAAAAAALAATAQKVASSVGAERCCASHHAFTILYNASEQRGLDMHHDSSDVTLVRRPWV